VLCREGFLLRRKADTKHTKYNKVVNSKIEKYSVGDLTRSKLINLMKIESKKCNNRIKLQPSTLSLILNNNIIIMTIEASFKKKYKAS